ncbi:exported hypothetical protein [Verrucomicrobia bacterium]|nr:exported hypothetical protein [Verrucomicrobiota bacterium]
MKLRNSILAYSRIAGIFLFASTAAVSVRADYPSLVLSNSPVAYWRFNETTPSPQPPVVSNVAPALGATGTGYIVDDVTLGQPGIVGNCALFDNAADTVGNCGSRIDVPFQPAINPNAPWTVECWVKPRSVLGPSGDANGLCPVSSMEPYFHGGGNRSGWLFYCGASGKWQMRIGGVNSYVGVVGPVSSSPAQVGVWQHIAGVFDGVTVTLYINGVSVGSATAGPGFKPDGFSSLRIGGSPFNGGLGGTPYTSNLGLYAGNRGWDGWVDEVAVFATALSSNTLFAHYSAATTNNAGYGAQILAANPVGYWHLDETAYTPPDPSTYPIANNSGSLGSAVNGTELLGLEADQAALPYTGFGAGNKACFFSGESGYLSFTNVPTLSNLVSTPITMMAWIKPLAQDFERDIIARGIDPTTGAEVYFRISDLVDWEGTGVDETAYYEVGETPDGATYNSAVFPVPAGDIGNWVFLAGTWDGSNWNLYRNGVLVAQAPDEGGPSQLNSDWSVGSRGDPSPEMGFYFDGYIDEPAIFTNALDGGTIQALYYAANVPPVLTVAPQLPSGPVYSGSGVTFTALAEGNPTLGYQWYKGSTGLAGQNATSLALNNLATTDGGTYSVIVTNAYGAATGSVALVVVTSPPIITVQPTPATRFAGGTFTFSVSPLALAPAAACLCPTSGRREPRPFLGLRPLRTPGPPAPRVAIPAPSLTSMAQPIAPASP